MTETKVLTKADINALKDVKIKEIKMPEWGGIVYIRVMSANEYDNFEMNAYDKKSPVFGKIRAGLCSKTICDAEGNRLYSDDPGEIESLGNRSGPALDRIFEAARKLNKMSEKDIEELEKNSESGPVGDSSSS